MKLLYDEEEEPKARPAAPSPSQRPVALARPAAAGAPRPSAQPSANPDVPLSAALLLIAARTGGSPADAAKTLITAARQSYLPIYGMAAPNANRWDAITAAYWNNAGLMLASCLKQGSDDARTEPRGLGRAPFRPQFRVRVEAQHLEKLWPPKTSQA
jgi:hypothetical protein